MWQLLTSCSILLRLRLAGANLFDWSEATVADLQKNEVDVR
jgi:hypothetical protein